jgi:hypothetical protein
VDSSQCLLLGIKQIWLLHCKCVLIKQMFTSGAKHSSFTVLVILLNRAPNLIRFDGGETPCN